MQSRWNLVGSPCTREGMGRNAWEAELEGASDKRSSTGRFGRYLFAVLVVGVATFVAAYYVPLLRAHRALTGLYGQAKERAKSSERKLTEFETDLKTVTGERDQLKEHESKRDGDAQSGRERMDALASALSLKLKKHFDKGRITLSTAGRRARLTVSRSTLIAPGKDDIGPSGALLLCDVAKATGSTPLRVGARIGGEAGAGAASPWESHAALTARVAQALADKCAVPRERLSIAVLPEEEPAHPEAGDTSAGVDLTISADESR
jgi:chemotaxis protein MotB